MRTLSLFFVALCACLLVAGCNRVHLGTHDGGGEHDAGPFTPCGPTLCAPGTICCDETCGICGSPDGACPAIACVEDCTSNADCAPTEYCATAVGACGSEGTCVPRPTGACPPVVRESCGCDGVTYLSPCDASAAGMSLRSDGACDAPTPCDAQDIEGAGVCALVLGMRWNGTECESFSGCECAGADCDERFTSLSACEQAYAGCAPQSCTSDSDCLEVGYCHFEIGGCGVAGTTGQCRGLPGELPCPPGAPPVCGCDGLDYACEDAANQSGISAAHLGSCDACGPMDATAVGPCFLFLGFKWNGAACESLGGCECEGADCGALVDTVEECEAAHAGCLRDCGGFVGAVCAPTEFCDFAEPHYCGGADETGVCRERPSACETVLAPACGCDGVVHSNACEAHRAGVDTWGDPSTCGTPPPEP